MQTRGRCAKCNEPRCRTHCKCGRRGTAQGRSAPRPSRNASASAGASASNTPIRPRVTLPEVAAVGAVVRRPAPVSVEVFTESALWIDAIIKEMGAASAMCVASYIVDDERFCNAVLTRLQGRRPFTCQVVVDDATFRAGTSRHQRARLRQLQLKKGASVGLAKGFSGVPIFGPKGCEGSMHMKAVVFDGRVAFVGSSNITKASQCNWELSFKIVGAPVPQILAAVQKAILASVTSRLP